jgi:hypothetical protein
MLVRKNAGRFTGWLAYTYSRTFRKVKSQFPQEVINKGKYYPSNFDKPHDVAVVGNFRFTNRLHASFNFTYNTGRPITFPDQVYIVDGYTFVQFSERNQARIPDYHRLDISVTLEESLKLKKKWNSSTFMDERTPIQFFSNLNLAAACHKPIGYRFSEQCFHH